ncbi:acyl-CoA dehydrogenase [Luteimonas wenzhouensis]|uniref:Acyl-CoA dehydrogenase n=1 Tax=Luteimonas wenzhouensis TaxID=2599615 RepID=A0A5C5U477_9GAMM|nr:acyl-CoA dehydrogenase [Luteimonas wenzhouensis]TWT20786.1 acyl-CoA dehydrogenase [Luteimonas wenzhouensis]
MPTPAPSPAAASSLEARARARLADVLPLPGHGATLARWRALAAIGGQDLALAKVLEAHHDAVAILAQLEAPPPPAGTLLAVWAAEGPDSTVVVREGPGGPRMTGRKPWCSGARFVDAALLTAGEGQARQLVLVALRQPGVRVPPSDWEAVGMAKIESGPVEFEAVPCRRIGAPGAYLDRPGFWHGGAGVAACWLGAAIAIAQRMADPARVERDPHLAAGLGRTDMALAAASALLRELAARVDAAPGEPHVREVVRLRSVVERACHEVLDAAARGMGPGPLCRDREHARRCADLAVFVRQSHADRDWAALGRQVAMLEAPARWPL